MAQIKVNYLTINTKHTNDESVRDVMKPHINAGHKPGVISVLVLDCEECLRFNTSSKSTIEMWIVHFPWLFFFLSRCCGWLLHLLSCCMAFQTVTDLFTQEPVRTGLRLASRCLRQDSLLTTLRWVWLFYYLNSSQLSACRDTHTDSIFGSSSLLPATYHLSFIFPRINSCVAPQGLTDLGALDKGVRLFSTSAMQGW